MIKKPIAKATLSVLVAGLAFSSTPVLAAPATQTNVNTQAVTSTTQRFPDVAAAHWANRHITKLSLLGIIQGNELGQYLPDSSVTQEEVITMLVRMLGWEQEALSQPAFYSELGVSDYAKGYLYVALDKGLVLQSEELGLPGNGVWGQRKASREWVAKLVIKAIGKQQDAEALAQTAAPFTDDASISGWARGYINEAVQLKIVNGMEDGSFKPTNPVTRAEMATFLSRSGSYAEPAGRVVIGTVDSATNQGLTIVNDYGDKSTYSVSSDTVSYGLNQETPSAVTSLQPGARVFLAVANGAVLYAEALEQSAESATTLTGTLVSLDISTAQLVLLVNGKEVTASIQVPLTITDLNGKGMASSALEPGSTLELQRAGSRAKYSAIIVKHIPLNKTAEGTVQSVDLTNKKVTVAEDGAGVAEYPLAANVVYLNGGLAGDLSTVKAKDKIRFKVTADYVSQIEMVKVYEDPSDSGKLITLRSDKDYFMLTLRRTDNTPASYNIASNAQVVITGMENATFSDLVENDQIKVMLTDTNQIFKIYVTNRSMQTTYLNTIVNFDSATRLLTIKASDGTAEVYELSDDTNFNVNGTTVNYASAITYLNNGRKLDITASSRANVKLVRVVMGYEGTVTRVSPVLNEVTLKMGQDQLTLKIPSGTYIDIAGIPSAKISDISAGDTVKINMESYNNAFSRIQVVKSVLYRLADKNTSTRQLTLRAADGSTSVVTIPATVKVYSQAQTEIAFADISLEEPYYVTYTGTTIEKVTAAPATRSTVVAVNASAGTITVSEAGGANKVISVGVAAIVKRDGTSSVTTLADLKVGDRIEGVRGVDGTYTLNVASVLTKQVEYYDAVNSTLYVLRDNLTDTRSYPVSSKVYVHRGTTAMFVSTIAAKDKVNIYLLGGKIIEVEKI